MKQCFTDHTDGELHIISEIEGVDCRHVVQSYGSYDPYGRVVKQCFTDCTDGELHIISEIEGVDTLSDRMNRTIVQSVRVVKQCFTDRTDCEL